MVVTRWIPGKGWVKTNYVLPNEMLVQWLDGTIRPASRDQIETLNHRKRLGLI